MAVAEPAGDGDSAVALHKPSPPTALCGRHARSPGHTGVAALANAEVAKRYVDQLWERNVEDPWDEGHAQWELYDEGADDMISYRAKL